jgi:hypothetical protein
VFFERNSYDTGQYARAAALVKLNGYEFPFRREISDFITNPKFTPSFWKHKGNNDDDDKMMRT